MEISNNAASATFRSKTITPGTLIENLLTEQDGYWPAYNKKLLISKELYITGPYSLNSEVTITNSGFLSFINHVDYSGDSMLLMLVIFKGTDGTIDFDVVKL